MKTIERARAHAIPWRKENLRHHVVRNNTISHCEQSGLVGSLGAAFSTVDGNVIHDIHVRRLFTGAEMAGIKFHAGGDNRFHNNLFVGDGQAPSAARKGNLEELRWISSHGLWAYDGRTFPLQTGGDVYCHGAQPYAREARPVVRPDHDPGVRLAAEGERMLLRITLPSTLPEADAKLVTTELLRKAKVSGQSYVQPDGSATEVDRDYFGKSREGSRPTPGPFEEPSGGAITLQVW